MRKVHSACDRSSSATLLDPEGRYDQTVFCCASHRFHPLPDIGFQRAQGQSNPDPKLVEGAKKEGQMIFYTTMTLDQSKEVVDRFQKKYPFIKRTLFRTGGGPLHKIFTGARGRHAWDVVVGRAEMVVPLMQCKLIASYRSREKAIAYFKRITVSNRQ